MSDIDVDVGILKTRIEELSRFREEMKDLSKGLMSTSHTLEKALSNQMLQFDQHKNLLEDIQRGAENRQKESENHSREIKNQMATISLDLNIRDDKMSAKLERELEIIKKSSDKSLQIAVENFNENKKIFGETIKRVEIIVEENSLRIEKLEQWRWYVIGIFCAIMFIAFEFPWDAILTFINK